VYVPPINVVIFLSDFFYLPTVGVEGYWCAWSHSVTHTHAHTYTLYGSPV
jgi:hypothetical protein